MLPRQSLLVLPMLAWPAFSETAVPVETAKLGKSQIILHLHPFLTSEELDLLRVLMVSKEALMLFVPGDKGHAAIAVAPDDGFLRDGVPTASATALADFADGSTARAETLKICDAAKKTAKGCVVILEIAPK